LICFPLGQSLGPALAAIRHHHEKLDGSGYPDGLKGADIPMVARIIAVADIYDALVSNRPYRKGMPIKKALLVLQQEAENGKIDTVVVNELARLINSSHPINNHQPRVTSSTDSRNYAR
jgi:HD-GYP domain-containing protein (c-di-GMP phosphodiesterase class II)